MISLPGTTGLARRVLTLLDRERAALVRGKYGALPALTRDLETTIRRLETSDPGDSTALGPLVEEIRERAERNRKLAAASLRGLKSAQRTRAEVVEARERLNTYTGRGDQMAIATSPSARDRRT